MHRCDEEINGEEELKKMSTVNGSSRLYLKDEEFKNWTKDQVLFNANFNALSGAHLKQSRSCILGSNNGAIKFLPNKSKNPPYKNKLVFNDFRINYEIMYPGDTNSPLTKNINDTETIVLANNQNIFSLKISSINYDYQSDVLYSWKLEGLIDQWTQPSLVDRIRYTSIPAGTYT